MNRVISAAVLCALAVFAVPAAAQQPPPEAGVATPAPNQFNDPAMSFTAPDGYVKAQIPPHDPTDFDQPTVVAAFGARKGGRIITITMETFQGTLDGFEMVTENELRNQSDGVFIKKKELTRLSNGMPAYWQEVTVGSGFQEMKRYGYVWIDGVRGVVLSISGRYGDITEDEAKKALANASGVAYPRDRY
jgi:hypothetical protein